MYVSKKKYVYPAEKKHILYPHQDKSALPTFFQAIQKMHLCVDFHQGLSTWHNFCFDGKTLRGKRRPWGDYPPKISTASKMTPYQKNQYILQAIIFGKFLTSLKTNNQFEPVFFPASLPQAIPGRQPESLVYL